MGRRTACRPGPMVRPRQCRRQPASPPALRSACRQHGSASGAMVAASCGSGAMWCLRPLGCQPMQTAPAQPGGEVGLCPALSRLQRVAWPAFARVTACIDPWRSRPVSPARSQRVGFARLLQSRGKIAAEQCLEQTADAATVGLAEYVADLVCRDLALGVGDASSTSTGVAGRTRRHGRWRATPQLTSIFSARPRRNARPASAKMRRRSTAGSATGR